MLGRKNIKYYSLSLQLVLELIFNACIICRIRCYFLFQIIGSVMMYRPLHIWAVLLPTYWLTCLGVGGWWTFWGARCTRSGSTAIVHGRPWMKNGWYLLMCRYKSLDLWIWLISPCDRAFPIPGRYWTLRGVYSSGNIVGRVF